MAALASKRKRDDHDLGGMRTAPGMQIQANEYDDSYLQADPNNMAFADMLSHHNVDNSGAVEDDHEEHETPAQAGGQVGQHATDTAAAAMAQYHTMTIPAPTEQTFMAQNPETPLDRQGSASGDAGNTQHRTSSFGDFDASGPRDTNKDHDGEGSPTGDSSMNAMMAGSKPTVGSDEWHKVRRDNHKEVERRRRETINEGINELAKIVPGCEKNKGSILARAVQFITQLKENESQNIEKWTLEKLLTEQAIAELSSSCDKLKAECQRAWAEVEQWKKAAQKAGASVDKEDAEGEEDS
ncbi:basic helix-loop-helix protein [Recurvomyces mirabilis]|uniref:Basic helix-loop-helix protein n=1 Tax=Recurvomyces mirabilis TaxID=574656 RepID=A0AAE0WJG2_9PEZI|nr:basic helix-loop-helix protein [Recurvomyces mirabilis]KAK5155567.1 basic helix-loop-helix protein [Recurvomyces mirabilis]